MDGNGEDEIGEECCCDEIQEPFAVELTPDGAGQELTFSLRGQVGIHGAISIAPDDLLPRATAYLMKIPDGATADLDRLSRSETVDRLFRFTTFSYKFLDLSVGMYVIGIARGWRGEGPIVDHAVVEVRHRMIRIDLSLIK